MVSGPAAVPAASIAVVIPVFNAAAFVGQAVRSALEEPEVAEVILVEDGSADDSLGQCRLLAAQPRVTLLRHPGGANRGAGASRNLGIARAQAPLIAFLDADDYYLPGRFAEALRRLAEPEVDGVHEAVGVAYQSDAARARFAASMQAFSRGELTTVTEPLPAETLFVELLRGMKGYFHLDGLTVRRAVLDRLGGFDPALRLHQDTQLALRLAHGARLVAGRIDAAVAIRRVHGGNRISAAAGAERARIRRRLWRNMLAWAASPAADDSAVEHILRRAWAEDGVREARRARLWWLAREIVAAPLDTASWLRRLRRLRARRRQGRGR